MIAPGHLGRPRTAKPIGRPVPVRRTDRALAPVLLGAATLYVVVVAWGSGAWSYDVWAAVVVAPVLTWTTLGIARGIAARNADLSLTALVMIGWTVKVAGSLIRWWTAFVLYDKADARTYDDAGRVVAQLFREGTFDLTAAQLRDGPTRVIEIATGVVYTITGPSSIAGFLVFAWAAFLGTLLLWRAFALAVPGADSRRYAKLLFLLPSVVYWPASLGKDAWMMLFVGIACYGAARILVHRRGGLALFALGSALGSMVRPHVMLLVGGGLAVGWLLGRAPKRRRAGRLVKVIGGVVLVAACLALFGRLQEEYGVDGTTAGVTSLLDFTEDQTSQGGSQFTPARVRTPLDFPWAAVTILMRPFPHEADNGQALASAAEGLFIGLLLAASWRRVVASVRASRRMPYLLVCGVFTVGFIVAFSTLGNFGLIARQRVQVLPFVLALVCLAPDATRLGPSRRALRRVQPGQTIDWSSE